MRFVDLQNHLEFFRGAVTPGARMTSELFDFYSSFDRYIVRSHCPSSILITFVTDTRKLIWSVEFGEPAREVFTSDILIDNKELITFDGAGSHVVDLPPGEKEITIFMPHLVTLKNYSLQIDDLSHITALPDNRRKLLICGDSILQGMTCSSPSRTSAAIAAKALNMTVHNTSVGGAIMEVLPVAETLNLGGKNDVIVVGFGINDAAQMRDENIFRKSTADVLKLLNNFAGRSIIITPIPAVVEAENRRELYSNIIREECRQYPAVTLLEGTEFFPKDESLLCDGLHPNDQGMEVYADALIKAIAPLL